MPKIDDTLKELEQGVKDVFESERWRQYLDVQSRFTSYSVNNCILIARQRPDATAVASYTVWRDKFHRQVKRGERGITIIAPTPYKKTKEFEVKDADGQKILDATGRPITEEREVTYQSFHTATVFDVSQTEGEPLPELVSELTNPVKDFDVYMDAIRDLAPVPMRFDDISTGAKGYYSPGKHEIVLQRGMSEEQTIKTFLHEIAHARLDHGGDKDNSDRRTREVQAESVAYCCCRAIGIDTADYSFPYISSFSSGRDVKELKTSLQTIREQSAQMISGIESKVQMVMDNRRQIELGHVVEKMTAKMSF